MTLKSPVRIGTPKGVTGLIDEIQGPSSAVSVGTILYALNMSKSGKLLSMDGDRGKIRKSFSKLFEKFKLSCPKV